MASHDDRNTARGLKGAHLQIVKPDLFAPLGLEAESALQQVFDRLNTRIPPLPVHELTIDAKGKAAGVGIHVQLQTARTVSIAQVAEKILVGTKTDTRGFGLATQRNFDHEISQPLCLADGPPVPAEGRPLLLRTDEL